MSRKNDKAKWIYLSWNFVSLQLRKHLSRVKRSNIADIVSGEIIFGRTLCKIYPKCCNFKNVKRYGTKRTVDKGRKQKIIEIFKYCEMKK